MNRIRKLTEMAFVQRIEIHLWILLTWFTGIVFSYFMFLNMHKELRTEKIGYSATAIGILCFIVILFSTCIFCFLFHHTYEENKLAKSRRDSNYIAAGLELLNERFILLDVKRERYEFLYTIRENEPVRKAGAYTEYLSYLLEAVSNSSDKEWLLEYLPLTLLTKQLAFHNDNLSIPIELNLGKEKRWDLLSFIVLEKKDGEIEKILLSRRDITETHAKYAEQQRILSDALEQAEKANKAKSTFLFNMSHDIRTPMNAIIGFTSMAKKHLQDPELAGQYLRKLDMSSQHMLHIVNDILDMARIDSGKVELELGPINIYQECYATDALFRSAMEEKKIDFSMHIDIQNAMVLGDAMRLKQVVVNLVSNAMKYTNSGGKVILNYRQTKLMDKAFAHFEVSVKDTGIGMSDEYQRHLFEAFERERNETVSSIQGTGLGLAIAKQLTDLMHGTLTCKSTLGVGTEFIFCFQLPIVEYAAKNTKNTNNIFAFCGKRILLVEDNDLNREIAVDMLEELGLVVEEASDGSIALEKLKCVPAGYYQLILMDIQMPHMDGYYATRMIRKLSDKKISDIPIIAMTANAFEEDRQKALDAGMNAHLSKPIDKQQMIAALCEFL